MAKSSYEDMSYEELGAEKQEINTKIVSLQNAAHEITRLMNAKQHDQKLQQMADKLSEDDKAALKEKL